jgi:hypothetical protein
MSRYIERKVLRAVSSKQTGRTYSTIVPLVIRYALNVSAFEPKGSKAKRGFDYDY